MLLLNDQQSSPTQDTPCLFIQVTLDGTNSQTWRNLVVPANAHLGWIHAVIQTAMGWSNNHLHQFRFKDKTFSDPTHELYDPLTIDETKCPINKLLTDEGDVLHYNYDFAENWGHTVRLLKKRLTTLPDSAECLEGEGPSPAEDCGGVAVYLNGLNRSKRGTAPPSKSGPKEKIQAHLPLPFDRQTINETLTRLPWPSVPVKTLRKLLRHQAKSLLNRTSRGN